MEANTTTLSIIGLLKWLFPSLIGSALAVWYKRHDVTWTEKTRTQKLFMTLIGLAAIIVGVTIAYMVGGAIIFKLAIAEDIYQYGVYFLSGLCSLKMLDAVVKNADEIIGSITKGIKDVVKNLINKLTGGS